MDNVSLLKSLYDAFGRGDVPAVLGAMPSGDAWVGPSAVLNNLFMRLGTEWDAFSVHPKSFHDAGDTVVVEGRYTGRYKATGKSMDTQMCHIWDVKDGKLTRFQQYVDTATFQDVMGTR